jgi:hypothetical protein
MNTQERIEHLKRLLVDDDREVTQAIEAFTRARTRLDAAHKERLDHQNQLIDVMRDALADDEPVEAKCDGCGRMAVLESVPATEDRDAAEVCDRCLNPNPRERGDDDGVEYGDPRDVS